MFLKFPHTMLWFTSLHKKQNIKMQHADQWYCNGNVSHQHHQSNNELVTTRGRKLFVSMPIKKLCQLTHWSMIAGDTCGKEQRNHIWLNHWRIPLYSWNRERKHFVVALLCLAKAHQHLSNWAPLCPLISSGHDSAETLNTARSNTRLLLMIITGLPLTKCQQNKKL